MGEKDQEKIHQRKFDMNIAKYPWTDEGKSVDLSTSFLKVSSDGLEHKLLDSDMADHDTC